jgi:glutamate--cysteine ligase
MTHAPRQNRAIDPARLRAIRRGIEKESLRTTPSADLAATPHPRALGAALTHPHITTDFSEAQVELVTGAHSRVEDCLAELDRLHRYTLASIGAEALWVSSMPSRLPDDEAQIPLGRYGSSNIGRAKTVYRAGLSHRYGRRMQTISGIHYNWSLPGLSSADYFALIRNFRRHSFLLLLLTGASPAVDRSFIGGRHLLQPLGAQSLHLPHATSLRMGRLGYQSDAQAELCVSYNCLDTYAASLQGALTRPYGPYEAIGVRGPDGDYRQLGTTLLQIENEFYGTIRPKRVIRPGERPLHALLERGVEYVEVRCMDLNPFLDLGIDAPTARLLDLFLLHCVGSDSPPDTPSEIAELGHNQQLVAARGREPGLCLRRQGREVPILDWAAELLAELAPYAAQMDAALGGEDYRAALDAASAALRQPQQLPSARVLAATEAAGSHLAFVQARSAEVRAHLLAAPLPAIELAHQQALAQDSLQEQARIEAADTLDFESFRQDYVAPARLLPQGVTVAVAPQSCSAPA